MIRITESRVWEVNKWHNQGMSQRGIALHLHMGRKSVRDILGGNRKFTPIIKRINNNSIKDLPELTHGLIPPEQTLFAERCVKCGCKVYMPCFVCQIRKLKCV